MIHRRLTWARWPKSLLVENLSRAPAESKRAGTSRKDTVTSAFQRLHAVDRTVAPTDGRGRCRRLGIDRRTHHAPADVLPAIGKCLPEAR